MKNIKKEQIHTIRRFDRRDFLNKNEEINQIMFRVLSSHESNDDGFDIEQSKEYIADLNLDILTKDYLKVRLYVLMDKVDNVPLCFGLFSKDRTRGDWHLEFISTNKDYCGMGYAEALFLHAAKDIANSKNPYISSVVNEDNYASLALHDALGRQKGIKIFSQKMDNDDELYDEYMNDNFDYDDYSENHKGYSNRLSFLFDVSALKNQEECEESDDVIM